ncbi:hypothetical protein CFP56_023016, partial [Quercus suber]
ILLVIGAQSNREPNPTLCFETETSEVISNVVVNKNWTLVICNYKGRKGSHCGVGTKRQQIGTFKLEVSPEWGDGRPVILYNGWIGIGKGKQEIGRPGAELHLRVKLDPDPRYVFQFEDVTKLSPQIVQLQGSIKQPIFSCKFSRER